MLDVATGSGDIPLALARLARRHNLPLQFAGCDISPRAVAFARRRAAQAGAAIDFFQLDALAAPLPEGYDAVICNLFLHHLSDDDALALLRRMAAAAKRLTVVCDLVRSASAWLLTQGLTRLLVRSSVVHVDGPLSIRAAFTIAEARELARKAGWPGSKIRANWPFRFVMCQWRTEGQGPA